MILRDYLMIALAVISGILFLIMRHIRKKEIEKGIDSRIKIKILEWMKEKEKNEAENQTKA